MKYATLIGGVVVLIAVAGVWYVVAHGSVRRDRFGAVSSASPIGSGTGKKPSPLVQGRTAAPAVAVAPPAPTSPDVVAVAPDAPVVPYVPLLPAEGVSFPADRKGFSNGCKGGTLTLARGTVSFTCPSNPGKGFSATLAQVKGADDDGIQLVSGEKYHFKMDGHDKATMRTLFETWYARAHTQ